jgi:hypothetical protein
MPTKHVKKPVTLEALAATQSERVSIILLALDPVFGTHGISFFI